MDFVTFCLEHHTAMPHSVITAQP